MKYSFIIPVYNRPDEVDELLDSLTRQTLRDFEVIVVEDGSAIPCKEVHGLNDLSTEGENTHEWGFYLYSNIVSLIGQSNFTIYYSDGFEIITSWFPGFILRNNVSLSLLARGSVEKGISATRVRELVLGENWEELEKVVPKCVFNLKETIKTYIEISAMYKKT